MRIQRSKIALVIAVENLHLLICHATMALVEAGEKSKTF
jgi:hypothetical protein